MFFFARVWRKLINFSFPVIFATTVFVIISAALIFRILEPETFPSFFDGLWYTMVTSTTVGYGDFFPVTFTGRAFAMIYFIYGIMTLTVFIGKIQVMVSDYKRLREEGKMEYKKSGHVIFIGYGKKTEIAIKEIKNNNPKRSILLIDNKLEKNPYHEDYVHFIKGDASDDEILLKANILQAERVFIFSDEKIDDDLAADGTTALIALGVENITSEHQINMHTTVEIRKASHKKRFKHAKVERFIYSYESVGLLMARECLHKGSASIFNDLLSSDRGADMHDIHAKPEWKTYKDAVIGVLSLGGTLLAVNNDLDIASYSEKVLPEQAVLTIMCNDEVFSHFSSKA
ncbi:potassium channel protein [Bacillaceae bacterium Marseille-Q3522]|nr:potassium channel protein [Bacillaceae bacterium Marseille-Q3522]